jgi:hypothetical protein
VSPLTIPNATFCIDSLRDNSGAGGEENPNTAHGKSVTKIKRVILWNACTIVLLAGVVAICQEDDAVVMNDA